MTDKTSWSNHLEAAFKLGRELFIFLEKAGFTLEEQVESTGNNARYDGWHMLWAGPIAVRVSYYEQEFTVDFKLGDRTADCYFIDELLFDNRMDFQGCLFVDNLPDAMTKIASEIEANYKPILGGDPLVWGRISRRIDEIIKEDAALLDKALDGIPARINPSLEEALAVVNNADLEGLRKKFAPKRHLLQIDREGRIAGLYSFKYSPTGYQVDAVFDAHPETVQIIVSEDVYQTVSELKKRVESAAIF